MLGGRYRIVGRLGQGGMGEVYRADDLKLGQQVALKFLTAKVDQDPARLMQLHNEVRMARQVSHPNVCRVYDIDEVEGQTFLSMEFVDGEELASLLRRFGRFSSRSGARDCAADLRRAGRGARARRDPPRSEAVEHPARWCRQRAHRGLRSGWGRRRDGARRYTGLHGAGTDRRRHRDCTERHLRAWPRALRGLHRVSGPSRRRTSPSCCSSARRASFRRRSVLPDLDSAIDRAIMRCLERDPADRPASALGVSAALPGGDPLAAALAAGETPSPEMVAASGSTSALKPCTR